MKSILIYCSLFHFVCSIPLPDNRQLNEEESTKNFRRSTQTTKHVGGPDEWARLVDAQRDEADRKFGANGRIQEDTTLIVANNDTVMPLHNIEPIEKLDPEHMPGVPVETDGDLNDHFKAEVILGPEHIHVHDAPPEQQREALKSLFGKIDTNTDGFVDVFELTDWFLTNIRRHMAASYAEGEKEFEKLDLNGDKRLDWHEYENAHLRAVLNKNLGDLDNNKNFGSKLNVNHGERDQHQKSHGNDDGHEEHLAALRLRWMRADEDGDDRLTLEEYSSFHHPEQHPKQLEALADNLMANFDLDKDGKVSFNLFLFEIYLWFCN